MKELNEYKDEIFRRSAEKKRKIQKHRRIACGVTIPLCLCCVITAVMLPRAQDKAAIAPDRAENSQMSAEQPIIENVLGDVQDVEESVTEPTFLAKVLEIGEGWVLVEPLEGESERNSCHQIRFSTDELEPLAITVGTKLQITYDGQIMETYPAQIFALRWKLV